METNEGRLTVDEFLKLVTGLRDLLFPTQGDFTAVLEALDDLDKIVNQKPEDPKSAV